MNRAFQKVFAVIGFATAIFLIGYQAVKFNSNTITPNTEHHGPGMAPGWVEQWRTIKGLKQGEAVPFGMYSQWRKADQSVAMKKKQKTELFNIKEIGPIEEMGGRTRDMLIDYADSSRIIACGISGGVWEGKNFGKTWSPINDYAANLSATCITQSPFEHNVMYYGTGEGSGNSAGIPGEGVFKSTDGGKTFEQLESTLNDNFTYTWDIKHSLVDSNTVYVSTPNRGLWRSTNAGDTFERVYVASVDIHDIEVFYDSTILIAVESRGIFRSKTGDLGDWEKLENGLPSGGFNRIDIAYSDSFPNVVYALLAKGTNGYNGSAVGLYKSSDGGDNWQLMGNPQSGTGANFGFPWYCLALGVDPIDTNLVFAASASPAFSRDGGKSWKAAQNSHADYHCFAFRRDFPGAFFVGNDAGIFQYNWTNVANNSVAKNDGYNVLQAYAGSYTPDSNGVIVGSQDQWSTYSKDGRGKFTQVYGGDGSFCHINQQNPEVAYVSSQNGNLRKTGALNNTIPSTIRAINNTVLADGVWFINPYEMNYLNGDMLFFPTRRGIWMSFDGAQDWTQIVDRKINMYSIGIPYVEFPKRIYFGGDNLQLWRLEDPINAETGQEVRISNTPSDLNNGFIACIKVHNRNDGTLFLAMSNYSNAPKAWRVDSAETENPVWANISGDLPQGLPVNWIESDPYRPDSFLIAATDFGLYITKNGGVNWIKEDRLPNVSIHNIRLRNTDRKLFVYTHGRGVWSMNLKAMEDPFVGVNKLEEETISIYPNPTSAFINVNIQEPFTFEIYNLNGKQLLKGVNQNQVDVTSLSKGSYIFKAITENNDYTSRFVVE